MTEIQNGLVLPKDISPGSTIEAVKIDLERKQNNAEFSITLGDITEADVDCIVSPSNPGLEYEDLGGVRTAIANKSGLEVFRQAEKKAQEHIQTTGGVVSYAGMKGVPIGFATSTSAGRLQGIKLIIHVNSIRSDKAIAECDEEVVRLSVSSALAEADRNGMKSVAIPAIGTGNWRMGMDESLKGTIAGINDHYKALPNSNVEKTTFVVYTEATQENVKALRDILKDKVLPRL